MSLGEQEKAQAIDILNRILEMELAGVVRYTHYSLMVYGYQRLPIVEWLQEQADEGLNHAQQAGDSSLTSAAIRLSASGRCWKPRGMTSATFFESPWSMRESLGGCIRSY
jgi:Ferritin-like domain